MSRFGSWLSGLLGRPEADRVSVRVGVSYRSDPDAVRALLERAAADCPLLLREPRPIATFEDFGTNALEFAVGGVAADPAQASAAASDLRTRILKAFRSAGIEIPVPQHDIHLRDLDAVRIILSRIAEERAAKSAQGPGDKVRPGPGLAGTPRRDAG